MNRDKLRAWNDLAFELNGGWSAVASTVALFCVKWVAIGFLLRLGWGVL